MTAPNKHVCSEILLFIFEIKAVSFNRSLSQIRSRHYWFQSCYICSGAVIFNPELSYLFRNTGPLLRSFPVCVPCKLWPIILIFWDFLTSKYYENEMILLNIGSGHSALNVLIWSIIYDLLIRHTHKAHSFFRYRKS